MSNAEYSEGLMYWANLLEFSVESGQLEGERIRGTRVREKRAARLKVGLSSVLRAESPSARRC